MSNSSLKNFTGSLAVRFTGLPSGTAAANQSLPSNHATALLFGEADTAAPSSFTSGLLSPVRMLTRAKSRGLGDRHVCPRYGLSLLPTAQSPCCGTLTARSSSARCLNSFESRKYTQA